MPRQTKRVLKGGYEVLGSGDFGCVIASGVEAFCHPERLLNVRLPVDATMVTKIIRSKESFENEKANAVALSSVDPTQGHLLYPIAFCEMTVNEEFGGACGIGKGEKVFLTTMQYGGVSLKALEDQGETFTEDETKKIYQDILAGLALLHSHGRAHGDLQNGNVLVKRTGDGGVRAFLIDFGRSTRPTTDDLQDFNGLILPSLKALTERGEYRNTLQRMITENRKRTFANVGALQAEGSPRAVQRPDRSSIKSVKKLLFD